MGEKNGEEEGKKQVEIQSVSNLGALTPVLHSEGFFSFDIHSFIYFLDLLVPELRVTRVNWSQSVILRRQGSP